MARALMVIDPQCDFINGTLPVPGAEKAMNSLADFIRNNKDRWQLKLVTCDSHPWDHCSFKACGGQWPRHCVEWSQGAAIWPALVAPLFEASGQTAILPKGCSREREEYSIFQNEQGKSAIMDLFSRHKIDSVDICGLAGDICVLSTLQDAVKLYDKSMFAILQEFSPSLDGGEKLANFSIRI